VASAALPMDFQEAAEHGAVLARLLHRFFDLGQHAVQYLVAICSPSWRTSALPSGVFMRSRMSAASVCPGIVEPFFVIAFPPWCTCGHACTHGVPRDL
jgi:hypothetical protein